MSKPFETWTVLPHGKLTPLDDNLLTVVGDLHMPMGDFPRRMTVVRLDDARLVIYSAIALDEIEMQQLERWGRPAFLIVPSAIHRMDAKIWKRRYPDLVVIAPTGARAKVEEIVRVDNTTVDFNDPHVRFVTVAGTRGAEAALVIERHENESGTTLVVNDILWNVKHRPGIGGWLLKVFGFTGGGPKIPKLVVRRAIKDREAFRDQLEDWASFEDLQRIVMAHGDVITARQNPRELLRHLSAQLAA